MYRTTNQVRGKGGKVSIGAGQIVKPSMFTKLEIDRLLKSGDIIAACPPPKVKINKRTKKPAQLAEE